MSQKLHNLFKTLKDIDPSQELEGKILNAIVLKKNFAIRKKLLIARTGLVTSLGVLAYTLFVFGKSFLESDFWNLAKLSVSDSGVIVSHAGDYTVSLLETLPVFEMFAILLPIFAVMMLLSYYFKFTNNNHFNHV
jgi:hypothetical protein